jgi:hypothetical protein
MQLEVGVRDMATHPCRLFGMQYRAEGYRA